MGVSLGGCIDYFINIGEMLSWGVEAGAHTGRGACTGSGIIGR